MNKKLKAVSIGGLMVLWMIGTVSAGTPEGTATSIICNVLDSLYDVLYIVAGGIGVVVVVLQGIKWASSADDPGARKQAKEGIVHAIVGLIIVLIAVAVVQLVFTTNYCSIA